MIHRENWAPRVGVGTLLGLGWVLIALNTVRAMQSDASVSSRLVGIAIPLALALVLFVGAIGVVRYGLVEQAFLIAEWTVLGTVSVTAAVAMTVVGFDHVHPDFALALFMIANAAGGGAVLGFLIGLYDAHQHRVRREWRRESERATALSQRLSVINRVLRHDIRNQAQIISGFTGQWQPATTEQERLVERLKGASDRLTELSVEAGEMQALLSGARLDREVVDLPPLVRRAGETVQNTHPSLAVEYDLPDERRVSASPLLEQAIKHLLFNAAEHNGVEQPRVTVRVSTVESDPLPVRCEFSDNGPGIPDHERRLTDEHRESKLDHSKGVGLWFVRWVVRDSDGEMEIETPAEGDLGTRVTLKLPAPE